MRYNQATKEKVMNLRSSGWSLNQIKKATGIPITTIRTWIPHIKLSEAQFYNLKQRAQKALQDGRKKAQNELKEVRKRKEKNLLEEGKNYINDLSFRDLFIAGVALYWAEGFKNIHESRLGFCNSDPAMIQFYIKWLKRCLKIRKDRIVARLTLNISYKNKVEEIQVYWSRLIEIPLKQFTKPFYQNSKWKKQYNTDNYHGVLRIHVKDSLDSLLKMKGWIEGLKFDRISSNLPG
ncbi:MAG: hypothetical protein HYV37_00580 [Candidatus Levyibacteriota bacterium]|nr:MAG: hypothetical protein HYV37_00580 [Candidatus Levybacteria bacterium]